MRSLIMLLGLDGKNVAISVNISDSATGLSDKLENGDIASVIIYDKENNTKWKDAPLSHKVITIGSVIVSLAVVVLAILQMFDI